MTRVIVVGEYRLSRGPDGHHYADSVYGRRFWDRYLEVFDEVLVVARVQEVGTVEGMLRVDDDDRVAVFSMPYYVGSVGYARNYLALRRAAAEVVKVPGVFILRLPGAVGTQVARALPRRRRFAVEVVGDPAEVLRRGVVDHPLRALFRVKAVTDLKRQCRRARAVAYVSRVPLARRYPPSPGIPSFSYSSATMPDHAFVPKPRTFTTPLTRIIGIGSMEQMYKGFDILLDAFAVAAKSLPELRLTIVGGGRYRRELEKRAGDRGISHAVTFTGALATPEEVRAQLDAAEIFVSASHTEGLPRTVIEAQARGLAVVATDVGGTVELVSREFLCPPGDAQTLASVLVRVLSDPQEASANAAKGWSASFRYSHGELQQQRNAMFSTLLAEE